MKATDFTPGGTRYAPAVPGRIASLDGLRAVSILLVIVGHAVNKSAHPLAYSLLGHLGNLGVKMFFLISGFLITTLLLKEWDRTGRISLRNFYIRRSLRIFPAFLVYVGVVYILWCLGLATLQPGDLLHALTYTMNYHLDRGWVLNHLWSLSVEEQFYLLWPAVVLILGPSRALRGAGWVILAAPLIRAVMHYYFAVPPTAMTRHFQAVSDSLAAGCLLAGIYGWLARQRFYVRFSSTLWPAVCACTIFLIVAVCYFINKVIFYVPGQTLVNFGIFLLLDHSIRFPAGVLGKVLNWRPLAFIGVISYSLYLWQELFLDYEPAGLNIPLPWNVVLTFVVSALSYFVVEKQFLKLKDRFTGVPPPAPATPEPSR